MRLPYRRKISVTPHIARIAVISLSVAALLVTATWLAGGAKAAFGWPVFSAFTFSSPAPAAAAAMFLPPGPCSTFVRPGSLMNWMPANVRTNATVGIDTVQARSGLGSLHFTTNTIVSGQDKADYVNYWGVVPGRTLGNLDTLSYELFRAASSTTGNLFAPAFRLAYQTTGGQTGYLIYEPAYNGFGGGFPTNTWISANILGANFWMRAFGAPSQTIDHYDITLAEWISGMNNGNPIAADGDGHVPHMLNASTNIVGIEVGVGSGWGATFDGNVDNVLLSFANGNTVCANFEPDCGAFTVTPGSPLASGKRGTAYPATMFSASGGAAPYTLNLMGLPAGMTFIANTLAGTPTQAGVFPLTLNVTDSTNCTTSTPYTLIITGLGASISDPIVCTATGNTLNVHAELGNPNNGAAAFSFTAPILAPLSGIPGTCVSNFGTCVVTNNSLTVTGSLPAQQLLTIDYKVRVADGTAPGTPLSITSTGRLDIDNNGVFDTNDQVVANTTFNCPTQPAVANTRVSDQKAGSVLVFPYYTSNVAQQKDTRMTISNISNAASTVANQAYVHVFFIDGATCRQADLFVCLTPNASVSFKASEYDPEATGWLLAVAVDAQGRPIQNNNLIGNAFVRDGDYVDNYGAEAFWANSPAVAAIGANTATLFFDGGSYDAVPSQFAVEIQSPVDAAGQRIVTAGLSGDLTTSQLTGASQVGTGLAFNEKEVFGSFNNWLTGTCQAQATIGNTSPRVPNGLGNLIKTGQSGYLKFNVGGAVGLIMTPRTATWRGIRTLHKTALTTSTIVIPIFVPVC